MVLIQGTITQEPDVEHTHDSFSGRRVGDLPPAYDALSIRQSTNRNEIQHAVFSTFPDPPAGPSSDPRSSRLDSARLDLPVRSLDELPLSSPRAASPKATPTQRPRSRKSTSLLSLIPFVSSFSAKRARQSILSVVKDLVAPSRTNNEEQKNVHEIFASITKTCAEHKLSLSTILQGMTIVDHTPMYWAVVDYREQLLVALLEHAQPLSVPTISDIRRACLVSSNQPLFQALRTCRPPFHRTNGIQVLNRRTASDNLILGNRSSDEIHITQTAVQEFVVSFDIPLWQKRMKVIGKVSIEFIASGRMWSVTFFSTGSSLPTTTSTSEKSRKKTNDWHVMVTLLESSSPTYFDSRLVVGVPPPPPFIPGSREGPRPHEARSTASLDSHDGQYQSQYSVYDYGFDVETYTQSSRDYNISPLEFGGHYSPSSTTPPPSAHPPRGLPSILRPSTAVSPTISICLRCGGRKLSPRIGSGDPSKPLETPTVTKPDTWSDHGVGYTNAAVSPLEEGLASQLMYDHSRYLFPDGTLRGRLDVKLVKSKLPNCVIC